MRTMVNVEYHNSYANSALVAMMVYHTVHYIGVMDNL